VKEPLSAFVCQRFPGGLRIWSTGAFELTPRIQQLLRHLHEPVEAGIETLKRSERRAVLRVNDFSSQHGSLIVKGFPLRKLESRWKYKKYGLSEFTHYQEAARRGIGTPHCHAYFEVRRLGLVAANGVLIEDLAGWTSLAEWAAKEPAGRAELLAQAIPLLQRLYDTGVNHIDPSPQNMLLSPSRSALRLIDWQYCSFVAPRQPVQLLMQAAHFLNYAALSCDSAEGLRWAEQLWSAAAMPAELKRFVEALRSVQRLGRLGAKERLALALSTDRSLQAASVPLV
jgi:hypothetical protein